MIKLTQPLAEGARCTRRNFCAGLAGLVAAPYVIRNSGVLMPVRQRIVRVPLSYIVATRDAPYPDNLAGRYVYPKGTVQPWLGESQLEGWRKANVRAPDFYAEPEKGGWRMGTDYSKFCDVVQDMHKFCIEQNVFVSANRNL